jgi:hypothetical protein
MDFLSMRLSKRPVKWLSASLSLFLGLAIVGTPWLVIAQQFVAPRRGLPGRRIGGGTRDPRPCVWGNVAQPGDMAALSPAANLGLTTANQPRFFWYLPKTRAKQAEFVLYKADAQAIDKLLDSNLESQIKQVAQTKLYSKTFDLPKQIGIMSVSLPKTGSGEMSALETGQYYRWTLSLICDANNRKRDIQVEGWVQRVPPNADLTSQLQKADDRKRVALYANNGYWYDTLNTLAELRCANPKDTNLVNSWSILLKSVKLDSIANQPLLQACTPKQ